MAFSSLRGYGRELPLCVSGALDRRPRFNEGLVFVLLCTMIPTRYLENELLLCTVVGLYDNRVAGPIRLLPWKNRTITNS